MLTGHPTARVDSEIVGAIEALAARLETLGAKVARTHPHLPDLAKLQATYGTLLGAAMALRGPSPPPTTAAEWIGLLDAQIAVRRQWAALFETCDVVLMPAFGQVAFPHNDEPDQGKRSLTIDGEATRYFDQIAWAGPASLGNLPSTSVPIGRSKAGLPIGMQIIGPYLEDRTTLGFAGLLEREFGGFQPPPGY